MKTLGTMLLALAIGCGLLGSWCAMASLSWCALEAWTWDDEEDIDAEDNQ